MLLEIIIPSFNGEAHLDRTLNSLTSISSVPENLDVLISLHINGSLDRSIDIARKYSLQIPNLKIYEHDKNLGFDDNLKRAVGYSTSQFTYFLGDDDLILSNFNLLLGKLRASRSWDAIHLNHIFINNDNPLQGRIDLEKQITLDQIENRNFLSIYGDKVSALSTNIFSTAKVKNLITNNKLINLDWIHLVWIYEIICMGDSRLGYVKIPTVAVRRENPRWTKNFGFDSVVALNHLKIYRKILKGKYKEEYLIFRKNRYLLIKYSVINETKFLNRLSYALKSLREFYPFPSVLIDFLLKTLPPEFSTNLKSKMIKGK